MIRASIVLLAVFGANVATAHADDWPQYRGPGRDDVSTETGLLAQWPDGGPRLLWTYDDTGIGYSCAAVVGARLYTIGGREETEFLIALDVGGATSGEVKQAWAVPIGPLFQWEGNRWSAGPSATPTVDGQFIYAQGGMGDLVCVNATTGREVWRKNLPTEMAAEVNPIGGGPKNLGWGFTCSPLVVDDLLIVIPGGPAGTVAALDKRTGRPRWRTAQLTHQAAYTSPMLAEIEGVRQVVVLTNQGVAGIELGSGRVLWEHLRSPRYGTEVINSPIIAGSLVYTTVGAGQGCELLRITRTGGQFAAELVYSNKEMANHHGNVVLIDGHVYGNSQRRGWVCQNLESGQPVWTERQQLRGGALTYADGRLYLYGEDEGEVVLIAASTEGWQESGRFQIPQQSSQRKPNGKIWTPPVVANGRLYLRDQELLFCYDVSGG